MIFLEIIFNYFDQRFVMKDDIYIIYIFIFKYCRKNNCAYYKRHQLNAGIYINFIPENYYQH